MIATDLFLMQQLILNSSSPSYTNSTAQDQTDSTYKFSNTNQTVMFIDLNELNLDGTTDIKRVNAAYIKYLESQKFRLTDMQTFKETDEFVDCTRITMFDDSYLFVSDSLHDLGFRLH